MTLIEAIIALTLLATGIVILTTGAAQALSVARIARHYSHAQHLLALVDFEVPVESAYELYTAPESGEFNEPFDEYRWIREAEYFGPEEDQLFLVRTRVYWSDRGEETYEEALTLQRDLQAPVSSNVRDPAAASSDTSGNTGGASETSSTTTSTRPGMRVRSVTSQPRSSQGSARGDRASFFDRSSGSSRDSRSGSGRSGGSRTGSGSRSLRNDGATDPGGMEPGGTSGRWRRSGGGS
ncbi:MAG: hypothetical protein KBA51_00410 [Kiritimatiellae bacterium]|nr:hypothetical protein [Kiritimatiellia bacterium]